MGVFRDESEQNHPDGTQLASAQRDTTVLIWDVSLANRLGKLPPRDLRSEDLDRLWSDLSNGDVARAHRALWTLVAGRERALPFLKAQLKPAAATKPEQILQLIANLNNESFAVREAASAELTQLGVEAEPALRAALKKGLSAEARVRAETILNARDSRMIKSPQVRRRLRAIQALEQMGTNEARGILKYMASGGPRARETQEAQLSLQRLRARTTVTP